LSHFFTYRHPFPIGQPIPLDSYITSYLFTQGSLIALMMEAARTSETSVDIDLTTRQYIPGDSELFNCRRENLKSHVSILFYTGETRVREKESVLLFFVYFIIIILSGYNTLLSFNINYYVEYM
jgi:hypothetical protein